MLDKIKRVLHIFLSKNFLKFCMFGVLNTFDTALFSWLAHFIFQENVAAACGYLISLAIGYVLSALFIFGRKPCVRGCLRFYISYIPSFIIYFLVTFITINTFGLNQFWGTVLAAVTGGPITFVIIKFYTFERRE